MNELYYNIKKNISNLNFVIFIKKKKRKIYIKYIIYIINNI